MFKKHVFKIERIGLIKSYAVLRKKAMEQEPSLTGLVLSLSIAFFIIGATASFLNIACKSLEQSNFNQKLIDDNRLVERSSLAKIFIKEASAAAPDIKAQPTKDTIYVSLNAGQQTTQKVSFKNIGKDTWKPSQVSFQTGVSLKRISRLYKSSWLKFYEPAPLPKEVKAGQSVDISFPISVPSDIEGTIQEDFQLVYNEKPIKGSLVRIFITISKANSNTPSPSSNNSQTQSTPTVVQNTTPQSSNSSSVTSLITSLNEPLIRVGLFSSTLAQRITFNTVFDVYSGNDVLISGIAPTGVVVASFDLSSKKYFVNYGSVAKTVLAPLRFIPRDKSGVATLIDYRNGPAWNTAASDNRFRNVIEMRYTEPAKKVWFINELPLETYLKGLAETTNASSVEFQKVMITAARSYAMYHYNRGLQFGLADASTKHADDHFHIDAYYDQVYRGYNSELRMPRLSAAVEATRGVTVTYENKTVVTPYFSNSDGRTRNYTEVWGGSSMPWLISVAVPQDLGKTLFGHGVGMSARGALLMINEGKGWEDVLKYFYTGITLAKAY